MQNAVIKIFDKYLNIASGDSCPLLPYKNFHPGNVSAYRACETFSNKKKNM